VDELAKQLAMAPRSSGDDDCAPLLFPGSDEQARRRLAVLLGEGRVESIHDSVLDQLGELIEIETPDRSWKPAELQQAAHQRLGATPADRFGTWVFYPWRRTLVHVLPEAEFRAVRTSRNRNKITGPEQQRLRQLRIGVVGLSVGQATAVVLAMEEIGGELVLADFDRLSLSNMNRLRAGVQDIGARKTVLTARQICELNPYATVTLFHEGLNENNLPAFLEQPRPLDVLIEECDDLFMKLKLRELARERRIPVVMETSDRGMVDIERFDHEPKRPLLHGLIGTVSADRLKGLSSYEKVPVIMDMLGPGLSQRLAASLVEVESTLKTWPQLASAVSLGAGACVDAVRRLTLGELTQSGRYYVDPGTIVADGKAEKQSPPERFGVAAEALGPLPVPPLARVSGPVGREQIRALVAHGSLAPSGGNSQPWRFRWDGRSLACLVDPARAVFDANASYLAVGAAIENITLAAGGMGLACDVRSFPEGPGELVASIQFSPTGDGTPDPLLDQVRLRVTNRRDGSRQPISASDEQALRAAVQQRSGELQLVSDLAAMEVIGGVLAVSDRLRYLCQRLHGELVREIRWSPAEVVATRDGVDIETLELTPTDRAGLRVTSSWPVMRLVGELGGGRALEKASRRSMRASCAVGLLTTPGDSPMSFAVAGRATQRLWLEATARGFAFQPVTALTYLFASANRGDSKGLDAPALAELEQIRRRYLEVFSVLPGWSEPMLFRLTRASAPTARALRRPVEEILNFDD
jgi:molybdopterin/thiamine biosynthesis adenylyltransferase